MTTPVLTLSPPQAAKRYGTSPEKILTFIRRGELRAMAMYRRVVE